MKLKSLYGIIFLGLLFIACNQKEKSNNFMISAWQTSYLKIDYKTYQKSDSSHVYEDKFENNPELVAQSNYKADGTFSSWFLNKNNERISESTGKWNLKNDSLFVEFFYNNRDMKVSYKVYETEEGFTAVSKYDWDEDGEFDDLLTMKTKRIQLK